MIRFSTPLRAAYLGSSFLLFGGLGACASGAATSSLPTVAPEEGNVALIATDPEPVQEIAPDPERTESPATAVPVPGLDTVRSGRFDGGRMWTFDTPPVEYFAEAYGLTPDAAWFERARLGALRIPGCSASFVSGSGLVLTNHHCAREHVSAVSADGEGLLDDGFYAATASDERAVPDFEADQLIEIRDVTDDVYSALEGISDDTQRSQVRESTLEAITERVLEEHGGEDGGHHVEVISLYQGARYSVYIFRRYTDVRLVFAPELQMGYFGGDPDNFTYPRYSLDFSLLRVYDGEAPLDSSEHFFPWSVDGVAEGDAVFVIGNPGTTSRIQTVAELEFRRDVSDKSLLAFLDRRIAALQEYLEIDPEGAERLDLRNATFSLLNSQKAYRGQLAGLADPVIMARKRDYERRFAEAVSGDPSLTAEYGGLIEAMAEIQDQKAEVAPGYGSFLALTVPEYGSSLMARAVAAFQFLNASMGGADPETLAGLEEEFLGVRQQPERLEEILVEARLDDFIANYGEDHSVVQQILGGRTAEGAAAVIVSQSVLADSAKAAQALEAGTLTPQDSGLQLLQNMLGLLGPFQQVASGVGAQEEEIAAQLGRARFEVYGTDVPPDATFSLRIADGVVQGYEYNGTVAPIVTTFYGLYDRYYATHTGGGAAEEWALPDRWMDPPSDFDLSTPFNFVSTADIIGGNSGSPVVNRDLELVGVAFDGNIESLPGEYIFLTDRPRTVSVDARGMLEALRDLYDADRLVAEIQAGAVARR